MNRETALIVAEDYINDFIVPRLSILPGRAVKVNPIGQERECHRNARLYAEANGGCQVSGWYFTMSHDFRAVQAIAHSVWLSDDGEWIDLTPIQLENDFFFIVGTPDYRLFLPADRQDKLGDFLFPTTRNKKVKKFVRQQTRRSWQRQLTGA